MSKPTTKEELLYQSQNTFDKLLNYINNLTLEEQEKEFPLGSLNRNIRDLLAHLHHWHLMMLEWYKVGMEGNKPAMPANGYTWKEIPQLNIQIQRQYSSVPLNEVKHLLGKSYNHVQQLILAHTDEELFTKKYYTWTGSTSLGAYLISATSSHYSTILKLLKKFRRPL